MERLERRLIYISIALMAAFTGLVVYASVGLHIVLPTAHQHIRPFTQGMVVPKPNNQFEVHYLAKMWAFEPAELILPENADVDLYLSTPDVMHGFNVLGTNLNLMAVPGTVNAAHHRFDRKGEYLVVCHEYCGLNHQRMLGKIKVVGSEEYTRLMEELARRILSVGEKLSIEKECSSCHSADGTESIGPSFKGLFGKTQTLVDGRKIIVDEAYLIESIKDPDKQIPQNYEPGSMPQATLADDEISDLVAYIKTLR